MKLKEQFAITAFFLLFYPALGLGAQAAKPAFDEKAVASFYQGKTVRIVVGFSAGGGYDQYSRVIARHLSKHIPGNPAIIVDNMPGVGSIIAANHVFNAAPKDGTVIGNISGPTVLEQLFGAPSVQFDMAKFRFLAVPVSESYLMIVTKKSGIAKLDELRGEKGKQITIGAIPGSTVEHAPVLMKEALNANLRIVSGYKGTADVRMALDGGEVEGFFNTWTSMKVTSMDKVKSGEWLVLAQLSEKPLKDLIVPNVPTIPMIARSEEQRLLLKYGTSTPNDFGKVYVLPPGVPADRAQALETAFERAMKDKELLAEANKGRLEFDPLIGATVQKLVVEFLGMPADIKNKLQTLLKSPAKK
ncbi:MAG TPA: tripartite tricarboxylate transporter substrate-binding protein [Candidatus Limnocylindria bacterium]|nr:tripartite tricarboxylate transporter substrate-binding protein [Candidatus Limnocylindria bacterium]